MEGKTSPEDRKPCPFPEILWKMEDMERCNCPQSGFLLFKGNYIQSLTDQSMKVKGGK
jgi:hypothetical protein